VIPVPERHGRTDTDGQADDVLSHNRALRSVATRGKNRDYNAMKQTLTKVKFNEYESMKRTNKYVNVQRLQS